MIGIVQPDADELGDGTDTGADADGGIDSWQAERIDRGDAGKARIVDRQPGNIRNHAGEITDDAVASSRPGRS